MNLAVSQIRGLSWRGRGSWRGVVEHQDSVLASRGIVIAVVVLRNLEFDSWQMVELDELGERHE